MKICFINNLYKPYVRGGAERIVEITAEELLKFGHQVVVISTKPIELRIKNSCLAGRRDELRIIKGVKNYHLPSFYYNLSIMPKWLRLFWHVLDMFDIGSFFIVKKILKQEKVDLVITHNLKGVGYLIPLAIKSLNIKHIHTLHDIQLIYPSGLMLYGEEKKIKSVLAQIYTFLCRLLFNSPPKIISPSRWLLDLHIKKGFFKNSRVAFIPNPLPALFLKREGERAKKKAEDQFTFLYVGQIEEHKGILFLIKAFKKFREQFLSLLNKPACSPQFSLRFSPRFGEAGGKASGEADWRGRGETKRGLELLIVGDGSKMIEAQKLAAGAENIIFKGRKDSEEVRKIILNSHCLIVPSLCYENSPAIIYEAFSVGLPVIASRLGGIPELVNDDFLFQAGDEDDLIEKMRWVMENKDKLKLKMALATSKISKYNTENYLKQLLDLF